MLIQIERAVYQAHVKSISKAGSELKTSKAKTPELSGTVPAMTEYIAEYTRIKGALMEYCALLKEDVEELQNVEKSLAEMDGKMIY